jgi:hypothetical protein
MRAQREGSPALYIGWDWFLNEVELNGCSNYPSGSLGHIGPVDPHRVFDRRHTSCEVVNKYTCPLMKYAIDN